MNAETIIFPNLLKNEIYTKKVLPHLKKEYFSSPIDQVIFDVFNNYYLDYKELPTKQALALAIDSYPGSKTITDSVIKDSRVRLNTYLIDDISANERWLMDVSEEFCKSQALYIAAQEVIKIIGDPHSSKNVLPDIMKKALSISFKSNMGHDYLKDWELRYEIYHDHTARLSLGLSIFDKITNGGLPPKTLSVIMGGINVGKTLCMCSLSAFWLSIGKNVLYVTLEMSETEIAKRIDANLMNVYLNDIIKLPRMEYESRINKIAAKTQGRLKIKEFSSASVLTIENALAELELKENFVPDIIVVDYLNLMVSARYKTLAAAGGGSEMYAKVKAISEELRGLAVEKELPILSATQLKRSGLSNSDPKMEDVSEGISLPAVLDFFVVIVSNEDLERRGMYMVIQLKNRLGDKRKIKRFLIGVDYDHQRLFDVENSAQDGLVDSGNENEEDEDLEEMVDQETGEIVVLHKLPKELFTFKKKSDNMKNKFNKTKGLKV